MKVTFGKDTNVVLEIAEKNTSVIVRETAGGVVVMIANSKENRLCKLLKSCLTKILNSRKSQRSEVER